MSKLRRVFVANLHDDEAGLDPAAAKHLRKVLRLELGTSVLAFDGQGHQRLGVLGKGIISFTEPARTAPRLPDKHLVLAVPRQDALKRAIRMATESGFTQIHLCHSQRSAHCDPRPERWKKILASAAAQCGQDHQPTLHPFCGLAEAAARLPPTISRFVAAPTMSEAPMKMGATTAIVIGPEGGLTNDEIDRLLGAGFHPISLGPLVLRSDSAVAAAGYALGAFQRDRLNLHVQPSS